MCCKDSTDERSNVKREERGKTSTSQLVVLTALVFLWSACPNSSAQKSGESSASTKQQVLFLNTADDGKHVSIKVGREIVITLQTIGPGQYETPQISSSSIRFKGSYFPREQNPGGPRQVYRFVAETVGEAKVEIPHSERNAVYRIIVQVKAN